MTIADILFTLLSLVGIAYVALWRFKQYRMDRFRQSVFALRDELFDYAAKGKISFNHPAYITLRNLMNGYIRFSHRISLVQVLLLTYSSWDKEYKPKTFDDVWQEVTANLDLTVKNELEAFNERAAGQLFYYVFLSSFVKKLIIIPYVLLALAKDLILNRDKATEFEGSESKSTELKVTTYKITKQHSEQIESSIDHLNTDALIFGSAKASALSVASV
jgi:cbb3-type cytochrome oxidase subunit 3